MPPPVKRLSVRNTHTHPSSEILRRLAFVFYIVFGVGAIGLTISGIVTASWYRGVAGIVLLVLWGILHWLGRRQCRFGELFAEIKRNPFKPKRPNTDGDVR